MDDKRLAALLSGYISSDLASALVQDFVKLRRDYATKTLERTSAGKFVETFVQTLQFIATGKFESKPDVDKYLSTRAENEMAIPDGLRICGARAARTIYTLRNKRNIAHKNEVDPNTIDLALAHQSASWILAELLRNATSISMEEAGAAIALVQAPVGTLVEEIDGIRLVHADVSLRSEVLILLHSHFPDRVPPTTLYQSMPNSNLGSIRNRLSELRNEKLVLGDGKAGYRLTQMGHSAAAAIITELQDKMSIKAA